MSAVVSWVAEKWKSGLAALLAFLWGLFIFGNSLQNGEASTKLSDAVVVKLPGWLQWIDFDTLTVIVRKSAHFCEYALLAALACLAFFYAGKLRLKNVGNVLFPCLLWAVCDEFLQTFVEGRTGLVRDVMIDFGGILAGCLVLVAFLRLWRHVCGRFRAERGNRKGREALAEDTGNDAQGDSGV